MRKTRTNGIEDLKYIDRLGGDFQKDLYKGIRIDFLIGLYGEDWKLTFDNIYGDDLESFYNEWRFEYNEWNELEE